METQHSHLESLYPEASRFEDIEKLLNFVKKGESCEMIAMPGVGRGNVLKFLAYNRKIRLSHLGEKQSQFHFVFTNFDEIKRRPVIDALKFIFLELVSSLHERNLNETFLTADKIFKESLSYHDELVLFQGLKEAIDYLTAEKKLHVIFLFERFETYIPMLTPDFFTYLRSMRNKAKYKLSFIFSLIRPLEDIVEPAILADFFEFFAGNTVYLSLTDNPGIEFRINYLEKISGQRLDKNSLQALLNLTSGHGKLTRLAVEGILGEQPKEDISSFLLSRKAIQTALKEIWDFLLPSEQETIMAIARNLKHKHDPFLEKINLIKDSALTIPLFKTYVLSLKTDLHLEKDLFSYDIETNTIRRGNAVISDQLTSSEFHLFKFLIENPKKILERDVIINAVWKDTASTLGVTDQALDQLIFRLRKKIEDNPNDPKYIQTVKGRGILFTQ